MPPEQTGFIDDRDEAQPAPDTRGIAVARTVAARARQQRNAEQPAPEPGSQGFAPEPPDMLERLFEVIEARRGLAPRATIQYIQTMLTTLVDLKTRTEQAVEMASLNASAAQEQLYELHSELNLFKNNLVPHSVHAYGRVIPKVTQRRVEEATAGLTKAQVATGLDAIKKEFASCRMEYSSALNRECFIVRTHNIILSQPNNNGNGIMEFDFGPFDIALDMRRFASNQAKPYFVIAIEPHLAPDRENCAHPHVLDNVMCEGNASDIIHKVLARGDLYTFFVIVNQTLSVYNRHSPHVHLERWINGARRNRNELYCPHCDEAVSSNDRVTCSNCQAIGHNDCFSLCGEANSYLCRGCLESYQVNGEHCQDCGSLGAAECIIRADDMCPSCDELREPSLMLHCIVGSRTRCASCYEQNAEDGNACCANYGDNRCVLRSNFNATVDSLSY